MFWWVHFTLSAYVITQRLDARLSCQRDWLLYLAQQRARWAKCEQGEYQGDPSMEREAIHTDHSWRKRIALAKIDHSPYYGWNIDHYFARKAIAITEQGRSFNQAGTVTQTSIRKKEKTQGYQAIQVSRTNTAWQKEKAFWQKEVASKSAVVFVYSLAYFSLCIVERLQLLNR